MSSNNKSLGIVIPFFNESRTLSKLIHELQELTDVEISQFIFVDDGSTDNSLEICKNELTNSKFSYEILEKANGGKSSAVKLGVQSLQTTHCLILDADLELYVSDISKLWDVVINGFSDFVFGFRTFRAHSSFTWRYSKGNILISNIYGVLFNELISDIMCGYKLTTTDFIKKLPFAFSGFAMEIEIPLHMIKNGLKPYEVEVKYSPRTRAEGKTISVLDAFSVISKMIFFKLKNFRSLVK